MIKQDQALRNMEQGEGGRFHDTNTNGTEYEDVSLTTFGDRSTEATEALLRSTRTSCLLLDQMTDLKR